MLCGLEAILEARFGFAGGREGALVPLKRPGVGVTEAHGWGVEGWCCGRAWGVVLLRCMGVCACGCGMHTAPALGWVASPTRHVIPARHSHGQCCSPLLLLCIVALTIGVTLVWPLALGKRTICCLADDFGPVLQDAFLPYLSRIVPVLIQQLALDRGVVMEDAADQQAPSGEGLESFVLSIKGADSKLVTPFSMRRWRSICGTKAMLCSQCARAQCQFLG